MVRYLGVPSGVSKTISEPMVCFAQKVHLSYINNNTISNRTKRDYTYPRHLGVPSGASKMIFEPMVRSPQTGHLSCVNVSTIYKRTETSFHLTLVTYEYRWVRPKRFWSLWYIWRKPCTYLAPTLTLSPNRSKRGST